MGPGTASGHIVPAKLLQRPRSPGSISCGTFRHWSARSRWKEWEWYWAFHRRSHRLSSGEGRPQGFMIFVLFVSHLPPIGLNVLGYRSHLLQRCHPACGHEGSSHLSPVPRLMNFYCDVSTALLQLFNQWFNFTSWIISFHCLFFIHIGLRRNMRRRPLTPFW